MKSKFLNWTKKGPSYVVSVYFFSPITVILTSRTLYKLFPLSESPLPVHPCPWPHFTLPSDFSLNVISSKKSSFNSGDLPICTSKHPVLYLDLKLKLVYYNRHVYFLVFLPFWTENIQKTQTVFLT